MLSDTMKQVQDAEQKAADIIRAAQNQAASIVEEAKSEAKKRRSEAESKAEAKAKDAVAQAGQAGDAEKEKYASSVNEQLAAQQQQAYSKADEAVDAIINGLV